MHRRCKLDHFAVCDECRSATANVQAEEVSKASAAEGQPLADVTLGMRRQLAEIQAELEKLRASQKPSVLSSALALSVTPAVHWALQEQENWQRLHGDSPRTFVY